MKKSLFFEVELKVGWYLLRSDISAVKVFRSSRVSSSLVGLSISNLRVGGDQVHRVGHTFYLRVRTEVQRWSFKFYLRNISLGLTDTGEYGFFSYVMFLLGYSLVQPWTPGARYAWNRAYFILGTGGARLGRSTFGWSSSFLWTSSFRLKHNHLRLFTSTRYG